MLDESLRPVPPGTGGRAVHRGQRTGARLSQPVRDDRGDVRGRPGSGRPAAGCTARATGAAGGRTASCSWGRADGQVKLRGFRVELGEIETRLAAHPAVDVAVAVVRGEPAEAHVVGYVTTTALVEPDDLRAHVAESLPAHMVP